MLREGKDNFDYWRWLRQVKEEEAQAKRVAAGSNSGEPTTPEPPDLANASEILSSPRSSPPVVKVNNVETFRNTTPPTDASNTETPKKSLQQRLMHVWNAWEEFQETRDRDAVYGYLRAVFSIVQHYRWKGRTKKLIRRAFKFAELPFEKNADPFAVVIRCTCEQQLDRKTISKWSRALRYGAQVKRRTPLKTFVKNKGGINACADLYTKRFGQGER